MRTAEEHAFRVSAPRDPFVGRAAELSALADLVGREAHRLVTVVGPPGVGKTRLLTRWAADHGDPVVVDVSRARDAEQVAEAAAAALGVDLTGAGDAVERVAAALREEPQLIVLDNFEQVAGQATDTIGRWLRDAPGARFVVSSREALRIDGERRYELGPLEAGQALRLFVSRAEAVGVAVEGVDLDAAREVVERLDRLPLAIELAAGRTSVLSVQELREQLGAGLAVLRSRRRDVDPRHATMRATIDWSWELLPGWGRAALAQLSVFSGPFDRRAARAVLDLSDHPDAPDPLDVLEALRERSLLAADPSSEGASHRFRLLASIRELARERLTDGAEAELRHARWLIERLGDPTPDAVPFRERIALRDELLVAFERMKGPEPREAARLCLAFAPLLVQEERYAAHESLVTEAVECARRAGSAELELATSSRLALLYAVTGRTSRARELLEGIVERVSPHGSANLRSSALAHLGAAYWGEGRGADAERVWREAWPLAVGTAATSIGSNLALLQAERGELESAERSIRALFEGEENASWSQARILLAQVRLLRGDRVEAAALFDRVAGEAPAPSRVAHACLLRAALEIREGRHDDGRRWLERATEADRRARGFLGSATEGLLALSACQRGDPVRAREHLLRAREHAARIDGPSWEAQIARSLALRIDELAFAALGSPARLGARRPERGAGRTYLSDDVITQLFGEPTEPPDAGGGVIEVALDGSWVRVGAAEPARLSRTPLLRRLLAALAEARTEAPSTGIPTDRLVARGWPGERILPGAASNRLHQAIGRLRRLGLGDAIEHVEGGYRLAPSVRVS